MCQHYRSRDDTEAQRSDCLRSGRYIDVVGPPSAEVCRTVANFSQVDDLRFINPWEA